MFPLQDTTCGRRPRLHTAPIQKHILIRGLQAVKVERHITVRCRRRKIKKHLTRRSGFRMGSEITEIKTNSVRTGHIESDAVELYPMRPQRPVIKT